jgi:hypothetical protein
MCGNDQNPGIRCDSQANPSNPTLDLALLLAFASVPYNKVKTSLTEKELVRDSVDFLAAKVPDSNREWFWNAWMFDAQRADLNAMRTNAVRIKWLPLERGDQGRFSNLAFSDQEHFGFILGYSIPEAF